MSNKFDEAKLREDLSAALRICAHLGMTEAVANHFSVSLNAEGTRFLANPKWVHFSRVTPEDLVAVDTRNPSAKDMLDPTTWALHGALHNQHPQAHAILHLHPINTTTISCFKNPEILPIDQNTARYFNRVSYDLGYSGMSDNYEEAQRICSILGNNKRLLLGNHGVIVIADTIGEAFDDIYTLERACTILVNAYATQQPLNILSDSVAEATAKDWEGIHDFSIAHFEQMKKIVCE